MKTIITIAAVDPWANTYDQFGKKDPVVPEPSTYGLVSISLILGFHFLRKRFRSK